MRIRSYRAAVHRPKAPEFEGANCMMHRIWICVGMATTRGNKHTHIYLPDLNI